jgi:hypothetical protein
VRDDGAVSTRARRTPGWACARCASAPRRWAALEIEHSRGTRVRVEIQLSV